MRKILDWLKTSNRWKHLVGGILIGICAIDWFTALYAGTLTAGAIEFKDKAHGDEWDWIDLGLTIAGAALGRLMFFWV
jgi:hypothetical protein